MKNNLSKMHSLDIFLDRLSSEKINAIEDQVYPENIICPLMSMDIYSQAFQNNLKRIRQKKEVEELQSFAPCKIEIEDIIYKSDYDALILTDKNQTILWVNKGFKEMTGYSPGFAKNKKPTFLQGKETSLASKNNIRKKLALNKPFSEIIINYKKNEEPYLCEVNIYPLEINKETHYLALEKEVLDWAS